MKQKILKVISLTVPIIGFIFYFSHKNKNKDLAKSHLIYSIISILLYVLSIAQAIGFFAFIFFSSLFYIFFEKFVLKIKENVVKFYGFVKKEISNANTENIISFLIPMVGLILYLTEKDKDINKANSCAKSAIWGICTGLVLGIISVIFVWGFVLSLI
jgi:uncharacterized membrane protein